MAAATSAIVGSYLGAFGTVGGAALGAIATTMVSHFYQHSIDTVHHRVKSKVRTVRGRPSLEPAARVQHGPGTRPAGGRGVGPIRMLVAGTLMIFLLALALVTGIEWAKGSSLSGAGGTTVQGVFHPRSTSHTTRPDPTEPQVAPSEEDGEPSKSSCPSDTNNPSESNNSGESNNSSESSCPSDANQRSDADQPSGAGQPSGASQPSVANQPSDANPPEGSPQSTEFNRPSGGSRDPRCRDASYPSLLCGPLRVDAR